MSLKVWNDGEVLHASDLNNNFIQLSNKIPTGSSLNVKEGLLIAIVGDSISTQYDLNACEIEITESDVGVELSAYATYYDNGTTIGDYTITSSDFGKELTFTPTSADIGKRIGVANNYNTKVWQTWWQYMAKQFNCEVLPVAWSGSSMSSHEENVATRFLTAHAWHDAQIRKMGKRIPGSMDRLSPDVIILYRGTNDLSHAPYSLLTDGYFDDDCNWAYPTTDVVDGGFGVKEAYSLTIKKIRETYPKAQIVLATLNNFRRIDYDNFPTNNGIYGIPDYNDAVREIAHFFGLQTIDFDKDGITWENCYEEGFITDSATIPTHPNAKGHLIMGKQAVSDLTNKLHIQDLVPINAENPRLFECEKMENTLIDSSGYIQYRSASFDVSLYHSIIYYPVTPGKTYYIQYGRNYCFMDDEEKVLATGNVNSASPQFTVTAPEGSLYLHICGKYEDVSSEDFEIKEV